MSDAAAQADVFCRYLLGRLPTTQERKLYATVIATQQSSHDSRMLAFATAHPWSLPFLDAYAAMLQPKVDLRQRLYVLFAVLEASPDNVAFFLPRKRSRLYVAALGLLGVWAAAKVIIGLLLTLVLGLWK